MKKIRLEDIKVKSFTTSLHKGSSAAVKGGI